MSLPSMNIEAITVLFTTVLVSLAVVWGINKAIIIAKSH